MYLLSFLLAAGAFTPMVSFMMQTFWKRFDEMTSYLYVGKVGGGGDDWVDFDESKPHDDDTSGHASPRDEQPDSSRTEIPAAAAEETAAVAVSAAVCSVAR